MNYLLKREALDRPVFLLSYLEYRGLKDTFKSVPLVHEIFFSDTTILVVPEKVFRILSDLFEIALDLQTLSLPLPQTSDNW